MTLRHMVGWPLKGGSELCQSTQSEKWRSCTALPSGQFYAQWGVLKPGALTAGGGLLYYEGGN